MYLFSILSVLCLTLIDAARILVVVPTPMMSHQVVFYPVIKELIKRGHEVVYITTDPIYAKGQAPANLTEIDTHDVTYGAWKELKGVVTTGTKADLYTQVTTLVKLVAKSFEKQMLFAEVQDLIKKKSHFDLLILEAWAKPAIALTDVFKAPAILLSSFGSHQDNFDVMGAPRYPKLLYPYCMHQKITNLSLLDKLKVLWDLYHIESKLLSINTESNEIIKRLFGPDTPTLEDMANNVQMLLLNIYPIWELNRPVPPSVVFIGGIHERPHKELPKDLKTYLDSSKRGVVYFSFGSNVSPSTLSPEKIQALINAFSRLQYDVLMKWDSDKLSGTANNTKVVKWIPQSDLLRHPKIKLFITQGGLQSFDEALSGGVPLLGIPMLGDQWYNVDLFVSLKIGLGLLMEELTEDKLVDAVNTVIDDPSYRNNMLELRDRLRDQPQSALERAVWWTEHVIRHKGAPHLRAPAANISWADYLDVELMVVLATAALAGLVAASFILYLIIKCLKRVLDLPVKRIKDD